MVITKSKFRIKHLPKLLVNTYKSWDANDPWRMSAIIAYYAVLSLPGLLIIIMNAVGSIWGRDIVRGKLTNKIASILGSDSAEIIKSMISETLDAESSLISTIIGVATILFGATGVFYQLQISLNTIWKVKSVSKFSFKKLLTERAKSFAFILALGFLLLMSFVMTTAISALTDYIEASLPNAFVYLIYGVNFIISIAIISTLFALMFRYMPDAKIRWKTVWIGAILTAVLFVLGESLLGYYFGSTNPASTYGAAGSIVLILLWVSYSCLILFFGAEFTRQYSLFYGHGSDIQKNMTLDLKEKQDTN